MSTETIGRGVIKGVRTWSILLALSPEIGGEIDQVSSVYEGHGDMN